MMADNPLREQDSKMLAKNIREILAQREKKDIVPWDDSLSPAAVLLPLYKKQGEYHILLTKRTEKVEHHKGQISFPGGAHHENDRGPVDTALRETFEEIGVCPEDVEILGELDNMVTLTSNFLVTPFVGIIPYPYKLTVNEDEIEELVEVPLSALADEKNHREEVYIIEGTKFKAIIFDYQGHVIWGATARILEQFLDLLFPIIRNVQNR
jgi:8-oxo-dGTP pyrophosphatase MutT (NUDIX family)